VLKKRSVQNKKRSVGNKDPRGDRGGGKSEKRRARSRNKRSATQGKILKGWGGKKNYWENRCLHTISKKTTKQKKGWGRESGKRRRLNEKEGLGLKWTTTPKGEKRKKKTTKTKKEKKKLPKQTKKKGRRQVLVSVEMANQTKGGP